MVVAIAVIAVAIVWWLRRPDETSNDPDQASGTANTGGSSNRKRASGLAFAQPDATGRTIAGVVVMDGAPVSGATVRLISQRTMSGLPEPRVISDAAGRFDFGPQLATRYLVVAEKPAVTGATLAVDLRIPAAQPAPDRLRLVVHACDASIHGTIRDSSGGVIAKARVELAYGGAGVDADDEGRYELCLPVGDNQIMLSADGYARAQESIRAFGRVRRDFSLVPEAIVVGRVVRADDRSPVANASIELSNDGMPRISLEATSDDDGRFRITGVTPGNHRILATGDRRAMKQPVNVTAEIGREVPVVLVLEAAFSISGRVVERGGGVVSGTRIYATSDLAEARPLEGITQLDGRFVVEPAPPGNHRFYLPTLAVGPVQVTVGTQDVDDVVIEVEPRASITGRVTLDGKPVDGCSVSSSRMYETTDADGRFSLSVTPGPQQLDASSTRVGAFARGPTFELAKGEHKAVEIELDQAGSIAGTVVDQHGAPVGGAMLEFSLLRGINFGAATTAEDGSFLVRALSGGEYGYVVKSGDRLTYPPLEGKRFPPIVVRDGKTHITGVRIAIRYERLAITGRVVSSKHEPIPDVVVRAAPRTHSYPAPTVVTDVNGRFAIRDLPAGAYTLRANSTRGDEKVENVQAGRDDVVIRFPEPGAIEGTLDGFDQTTEIAAVRTDGTARYRTTASGNTFSLRTLAPGSYRVAASSPNGVANETAMVSAGGVARLTLRKVGMGVVVATVVDDTGRPVPKLRCYLDRAYVYVDSDDVTDGAGQFRFEKVLAGTSTVACYGDSVVASGQVTVVAGRTTRVELETEKRAKRPAGYAGFELGSHVDDIVVKAVLAGGPAERAGVLVGDVVVKIDDRDPEPYWRTLDAADVGTKVKLTLERADKERIIYVTIEAAPGTPP